MSEELHELDQPQNPDMKGGTARKGPQSTCTSSDLSRAASMDSDMIIFSAPASRQHTGLQVSKMNLI